MDECFNHVEQAETYRVIVWRRIGKLTRRPRSPRRKWERIVFVFNAEEAEKRCARREAIGLPERSEPEGPQGAASRRVFCAYAQPRKCCTETNRKWHKETAPFLTRLRYSTLTYPLLPLDLKEEACRLFVLLSLGRNSKLHITIIRLSGVDLNCI